MYYVIGCCIFGLLASAVTMCFDFKKTKIDEEEDRQWQEIEKVPMS
jgi:hypothetical protein